MNISEMGCTNVVMHKIELEDSTHISEKPRPIPPGYYDELQCHLQELVAAVVIEEGSNRPFCHNMFFLGRRRDLLDCVRILGLQIENARRIAIVIHVVFPGSRLL